MAQWVKDLVLPQLWHRPQLWLWFDPWPGNFHMLQMQPEKKKLNLDDFKWPLQSHLISSVIFPWAGLRGQPVVPPFSCSYLTPTLMGYPFWSLGSAWEMKWGQKLLQDALSSRDDSWQMPALFSHKYFHRREAASVHVHVPAPPTSPPSQQVPSNSQASPSAPSFWWLSPLDSPRGRPAVLPGVKYSTLLNSCRQQSNVFPCTHPNRGSCFGYYYYCCCCCLGLHRRHMKAPRLGVESEL